MNPLPIQRDQMWTDTGKPGKPAFNGRQMCRSAPDHGQGSASRCLTGSPVARLGGIAILPSHRISFARRLPSSGLSERRLGFTSSRSRAATKFSAALLIGRSHQLNRISDKPGSDLAYPSHSISPSCWSHVPHSGTCHRGRTINWVSRTK